jgi:hypothetical protein
VNRLPPPVSGELDSVCDLFRAHLLAPGVVPTRATLGEYVCLHADKQRDCTEDSAGNEQPSARLEA